MARLRILPLGKCIEPYFYISFAYSKNGRDYVTKKRVNRSEEAILADLMVLLQKAARQPQFHPAIFTGEEMIYYQTWVVESKSVVARHIQKMAAEGCRLYPATTIRHVDEYGVNRSVVVVEDKI